MPRTYATLTDARIVAAFGVYLGMARNATAGEVKTAVIKFVKEVVRNAETKAAIAAISIEDITPT